MEIQKTAIIPLIDLSECNINHSKKILDRLKYSKAFYPSGKSYLAESRYKGSEKIIKDNEFKQIIELGSGFTPHAVNLRYIKKYIEVDFLENSEIKQEIIDDLFPKRKNIVYISGDVFKKEAWQKIW